MTEATVHLGEGVRTALLRLVTGKLDGRQWMDWWQENRRTFVSAHPEWAASLQPYARVPGYGMRRCHDAALDLLAAARVRVRGVSLSAVEAAAEIRANASQDLCLREVAKRLEPDFPRFSWYLRGAVETVELVEPGLTEAELKVLEHSLGAGLPSTYRRWLGAVSELVFVPSWAAPIFYGQPLPTQAYRRARNNKEGSDFFPCCPGSRAAEVQVEIGNWDILDRGNDLILTWPREDDARDAMLWVAERASTGQDVLLPVPGGSFLEWLEWLPAALPGRVTK